MIGTWQVGAATSGGGGGGGGGGGVCGGLDKCSPVLGEFHRMAPHGK
eukprot:CAMPEP_0119384970 /NCGR_PEP_ID=MMETSP1334-20130426/88608_1 /TAXON_ID=127549 /ORGANISM="Calcidiscus leptoporus, Strain RCC1130" /LENGTH=46 /DNA_ID= /DNA_START= /DNA_END= /DNA_ORIENTATION=